MLRRKVSSTRTDDKEFPQQNTIMIFLILNALVSGASYCSENSMCIVSYEAAPTGQDCFTIHSAAGGWAGFGVGINHYD